MSNTFADTLKQYNLLEHPFYLAWNEGKLTREQLSLYAGEYGSFIKLISQGWQQAGEHQIASEEIEHFALWQNFAGSISAKSIAANAVHGSDSDENAAIEGSFFFSGLERF